MLPGQLGFGEAVRMRHSESQREGYCPHPSISRFFFKGSTNPKTRVPRSIVGKAWPSRRESPKKSSENSLTTDVFPQSRGQGCLMTLLWAVSAETGEAGQVSSLPHSLIGPLGPWLELVALFIEEMGKARGPKQAGQAGPFGITVLTRIGIGFKKAPEFSAMTHF